MLISRVHSLFSIPSFSFFHLCFSLQIQFFLASGQAARGKMASYEMKNRQILSNHEAEELSSHSRDDLHLRRLGKKPVLKVGG
jgi:hypothetical protein